LEMLHRMDGDIRLISTRLHGFDKKISRMSSRMTWTERKLRQVGRVQASLLTHLRVLPIDVSPKHIEDGDEEQRSGRQVDLAHDDVEDWTSQVGVSSNFNFIYISL